MARRTSILVRRLEADGWVVTRRRSGHLMAIHPEASSLMFIAATPSDIRSERNALAMATRFLKEGRKKSGTRK